MVHKSVRGRHGLVALGIVAIASASMAAVQARPAPVESKTAVAALGAYLEEEARRNRLSGAVIVARNGEAIFENAYGLANLETGERNTPDTKFNLASAGKLLTRIAVLQLMQAGKLGFDDKVGKHLPDYPNSAVREKVTIGQLYEMRSGVGSYWNDKFWERRSSLRTTDDYLALFATDPLAFEPGSQFMYSNGGYLILGKIIEVLSGMGYDEYVRRHILAPSGMADSGHFAVDEKIARLAVGYTSGGGGGVGGAGASHGATPVAGAAAAPGQGRSGQGAARMTHGQSPPPGATILRPNTDALPYRGLAAGGGYSTVRDFLKLDRALRRDRLLDAEHRRRLFGPRFAEGEGLMAVAGGYAGANTAFFAFPDGTSIIVFTNRDAPVATETAAKIAEMLGKRLPPMRRG